MSETKSESKESAVAKDDGLPTDGDGAAGTAGGTGAGTGEEAKPATTTDVSLAYAAPSRAVTSPQGTRVALFGNLRRDPVRLESALADPLRFREAMSVLYAIVGSDYRYVPKDRTAYSAFVRMRRESAKLSVWQSQQEYFSWLLRNDPNASLILDPILTVHPDQIFVEVFSKDEGTYAKLVIDLAALKPEGEVGFGTTNIDLSTVLHDSLQQVRRYRPTRLSLRREADGEAGEQRGSGTRESAGKPEKSSQATKADGNGAPPGKAEGIGAGDGQTLEKQIRVPDSWLRGFLQVQSAAALPLDSFSIAPMDLYNLLRQLRLHADLRGKRRGLKVELVPGEKPRLVVEPWELVMQLGAELYKGRTPKVVRLWGRRRLMMLRRLLPFIESIDVHLVGSGLPSFWVFRCGAISLTLGLTGFTSSNWSQAVSFDLLLPRKGQDVESAGKAVNAVLAQLKKTWFATAKELSAATGLTGPALVEALQTGCQQGRLMYDLAGGVYRLRPLTDAPLDLSRLEYRNQRERIAHDLLVRRGAVKIVSENRIPAVGLELTGKVAVEEDKREYRPQMLLGDEGQVSRAECTCAFYRKQGLKAGPCVHLIALRLAYAEKARTGGGGQAVTVETRTFSKRDERGEDVVQVSLERQRLKVRRGRGGEALRLQTLQFNSPEDARAAYFARVEDLDAKGFLDATAG